MSFAEFAPEIRDAGYSVIPVLGKRPAIRDWSRFCKEIVDDDLFEKWCTGKYKDCGIGLCLGPASGLVAFDCDTDDKEILDVIRELLPPALLVKKGAKGFTAFYRYNKERSQTIKYKGMQVADFLSDGRQTVIPPSIHPGTNEPYKWMMGNYDLTNIGDDIYDMPFDFLDRLKEAISRLDKKVDPGNSGRNDALKKMAFSLIGQGLSEREVARRIYLFDKSHHSPALFSDPTEFRETCNEPQISALHFVQNMFKYVESNGTQDLSTPYPTKDDGFFIQTFDDKGKSIQKPDLLGMSRYFRNELHFKNDDHSSMIYNGRFYEPCSRTRLNHTIKKLSLDKARPNHVDQFAKDICSECYVDFANLDKPTGKINLKNGVLEISTRILMGNTSDYYFTYQLDHEYKAGATCPKFKDWLTKIFDGDAELVDVTFQIFGYCLQGGAPWLHKAFVLFAEGRNGKSTWLKVLQHLLGKANYSAVSMSNIDKPFSVVNIDGKLANIVDESPTKSINNESFKIAVGGGELTAAQKYKSEYEMKFNARMLFSANSLPRFNDATAGLYEKLYIIPFNTYIPESERIGNYEERFFDEMSGILNESLSGLERLKSRGSLPNVNAVSELLSEYRYESDSVYMWCQENLDIETNETRKIDTKKLFRWYKNDVEGYVGHPVEYNSFSKRIASYFKEQCRESNLDFEMMRGRTKKERFWTNIKYSGESL